MSSGWAWGHFGYSGGCPEARLCIPMTYRRHTLGGPRPPNPRIQPYHTFCNLESTCGLPIVAYGLHNHISLKLTCMAYLWLILRTLMALPAAHPEYPLNTPLAHRTSTLRIPKTTINIYSAHPWHIHNTLVYPCCSLQT